MLRRSHRVRMFVRPLERRITPTAYTWDGSSNSWATAASWTPNGIPGAGDDVTINSGQPNHNAGNTSVSSINLAGGALFIGGGSLSVTAGLTVSPSANYLYTQGGGTSFTASGTINISGGAIYAENGSTITINNLTTLTGSTIQRTLLQADSAGILNLPNLSSVSVGASDQYVELRSTDPGSTINAVNLASVTTTSTSYANLYAFNSGQISVNANLKSLNRVNLTSQSTAGFPVSQLTSFVDGTLITDNANVSMNNLATLSGSAVYIRSNSVVTMNNLTSVTGSPSYETVVQTESGANLSLPALTTVNANVNTFLSFRAYDSKLTMPAVTKLDTGYVELRAQGGTAVLDASGLTTFTPPTNTYGRLFAMGGGGQVQVAAGFTALNAIDFVTDSAAGFPTGQLTTITASTVSVNGGAPSFANVTTLTASNVFTRNTSTVTFTNLTSLTGSTTYETTHQAESSSSLSFPALTTVNANSSYFTNFRSYSGGTVTLAALGSVNSGYIDFRAYDASSSVNLPSLTSLSFPTMGPYGRIYGFNGGKITVNTNYKVLNNIDFQIDAATAFPVGQLTTANQSYIFVHGGTPVFTNLTKFDNTGTYDESINTANAGTVASFPALNTLICNSSSFTHLRAYSGSTLSLPVLTSVSTGYFELRSQDPGSLLDLPALTGMTFPTSTYGIIAAVNAGKVNVAPGYSTLNSITAYFESTNCFPVGQITSIVDSTLYFNGGTLTFTACTTATNSTLQAANASTLANFPALTTFNMTNNNFAYIQSYYGAKLSAPTLTTINTGHVQLLSQYGGAILDLPALASLTFPPSTYGNIYANNNGQINVAPGFKALDRVNFYVDAASSFPCGQLTSVVDSSVYVQGGTVTFTNLATVSGSRLQTENVGTVATFPAMVNFNCNTSFFSYIHAYGGSKLSAPALTGITTGYVQILAQYGGAIMDLPALNTLTFPTGTYGNIYAVSGNSAVNFGPTFNKLSAVNVYMDSTNALSAAGQLTSIEASSVYVQGGSPSFTKLASITSARLEAQNTGTVANFPVLTTLNTVSGNYNYLDALYGGKLSAPALTTLNSGYVQLVSQYSGSVLDLPALTTFTNPTSTYGYIFIQYDSAFNTAANLQLGNLTFTFDDQAKFNFTNLDLGAGAYANGYGKLPGNVINSGYIDVNFYDPRALEITGNYTQTPTGELRIDLYGTGKGTSYDWLNVGGTVNLDGTLTIQRLYGYAPVLNDVFTPVSGASRTGTFSNYNNLLIGGGLELQPSFTATSAVLTTVLSSGPFVTNFSPTGTVFTPVTYVDVTFNKPIVLATVTNSQVVITGPGGPYTLTGYGFLGGSSYRFYTPNLATPGLYTVNIGPDITDIAGSKMNQNGNGIFGENPDDIYTASFTVATADLIIDSITPPPANLNFGQTININYVGKNIGTAATPNLVAWNDYVYLSTDAVLDGGDQYVGFGAGPGFPVPVNGTYSGTATVTLPLAPVRPDGNYFLIVQANASNTVPENTTNNSLATSAIAMKTPPRVVSFEVNNGAAQRSMVNAVSVTFNEVVNLPVNAANAFSLFRLSPGAPNSFVGLTVTSVDNTAGQTKVSLGFQNGALYDGRSLMDGRYELKAIAAQITDASGLNLDGNGNGVTGDDYATNGVHRFFGDIDGDGTVAANDFIQFRLALGGSNPLFDFEGDGAVAASDFIQFRLRFGGSV